MTTRAKSRIVGVSLLLDEEEEEVEEGEEGDVDEGKVVAEGESRRMPLEVAAAALAVWLAVVAVSAAVLGMMVDTMRRARVGWG